jgi:hypothetical protein
MGFFKRYQDGKRDTNDIEYLQSAIFFAPKTQLSAGPKKKQFISRGRWWHVT